MKMLTNYLMALGWAVVGAVAMAIALVLLLRVFTWLTPIDEWAELRQGNVVEATGIADFQRTVSHGISEPLLKWKAIEVAHELSNSPNSKIIVLGDNSGLPIILSDK